ncbi:MAG: DUF3365 domain-containing protein [Alphaproteobacteria bacterium]
MKRRFCVIVPLLVMGVTGACRDGSADQAAIRAASDRARGAIAAFQGALKARLLDAIATGGAISAIGVCKEAAPAIAARSGDDAGVEIGRTALKIRNAANAPDAWERGVLERFEDALAKGRPAGDLFETRVTGDGDRRVLRTMAPIMTGGLCLTCHGAQIDPDLAAEIDRLYPNDRARGFALDSLRGAFTVTVPLAE